jgi:acetyl-CoA synthetase
MLCSISSLLLQQWDAQHHACNFDLRNGPIFVNWFKGGRTNVTYNCLDRWVAAGRGNQVAFIW